MSWLSACTARQRGIACSLHWHNGGAHTASLPAFTPPASQHGRIADFVVRDPMVIGHEAAGVIVAMGDACDAGLAVGDVVALEPGVPCWHCPQARQGGRGGVWQACCSADTGACIPLS